MQDKADSAINRNKTSNTDTSKEMDILGETSKIAGQLVRKISDNDINSALQKASDLLTVNSFNEDPVIKEGSHLLTGVTLNMTITVPDNFDYCC